MARFTAADKRVIVAVRIRATLIDEHGMDYEACEVVDENGDRCGHNGTKYPLEIAHKEFKSQGGRYTMANCYLGCMKCHKNGDHGWRIQ